MARFVWLLVSPSLICLFGCGPQRTSTGDNHDAGKIVGTWQMIENRDQSRGNPPAECIEFGNDGGFVLRMNGRIEMIGAYRVEKDKLILTHGDRQTQMGKPSTIKRLSSDSLILTSTTGRDTEYVRQ